MGLHKCIMACVHHYSITESGFTALKILSALPIHPSHSPQPLAITGLFTLSIVLSFPECHIVGIIQYVAFTHWLLSLTALKFPLSFHGLIAHFFLALNNIPLFGCTTIYLSIHLLRDILVASKFS